MAQLRFEERRLDGGVHAAHSVRGPDDATGRAAAGVDRAAVVSLLRRVEIWSLGWFGGGRICDD